MRLISCSLLLLPFAVGCSDPVPNPYEGAWKVDFVPGSSGSCSLEGGMLHPATFGDLANEQCANLNPGYPVDNTQHCGMLMDGALSARVFCAVRQQGGGYTIRSESRQGANYLVLDVPSITSASGPDGKVPGSVTFSSGETVNTYASTACEFWFNGAQAQTSELAPGKAWLSFECPQIVSNGYEPSTCTINESYAAFDYCEE
jgi:hypothetical protein